jgi:hypothetical protein
METRWFRRLGPGIAALGAMAAVASTTAGEPPPTWQPPACSGQPAIRADVIGAWFRLDPILAEGEFVGQWLSLGRADAAGGRRLELDPESFASGPAGGTVLAGSDDGRASALSVIDVSAGCRWVFGESRDVVRNAVLDPTGGSIVESRVDRRTRADLGIWRRPLDGGAPLRLLPPIAADGRFGPTWLTDLSWSEDGGTLVVASCGEVACRYRLMSAADASTTTIADPTIGSRVGMADGWLVAREACRGLPCPIVSLAVDRPARVVLDDAAGIAVMARDDGGNNIVVHEAGADDAIRAIRPDGSDRRSLPSAPAGLRLVGGAAFSASAAEAPDGAIAFGPDGRVAPDASRGTFIRPIATDVAVPLGEVTR